MDQDLDQLQGEFRSIKNFKVYFNCVIEENVYGKMVLALKENILDHSKENSVVQIIQKNSYNKQQYNEYKEIYKHHSNLSKNSENILKPLQKTNEQDIDFYYFFYEFFDQNILQFIKQKKEETNVIEQSEFLEYVKQVIKCYRDLQNSNLIHGCLIPQNIVLNSQKKIKFKNVYGAVNGPNFYVELFTNMNKEPIYFDQEIIRDPNSYSQQQDAYSMGVILFQLIYEELPTFDEDNNDQVIFPQNGYIENEELKNLIQCMLKKDPNERIAWPEIFKFIKPKQFNPFSPINEQQLFDFQFEIEKILFERNKISFLNQIVVSIIKNKDFFTKDLNLPRTLILKILYLLLEKQRIMYNSLLMNLQIGQNIDKFQLFCKQEQYSMLKNQILNEAQKIDQFIKDNNFIPTLYCGLLNSQELEDKLLLNYLTSNNIKRIKVFQDAYNMNITQLIKTQIQAYSCTQPQNEILLLYLYLIYANSIETECKWDFKEKKYFDFQKFYEYHSNKDKNSLMYIIIEKMDQLDKIQNERNSYGQQKQQSQE